MKGSIAGIRIGLALEFGVSSPPKAISDLFSKAAFDQRSALLPTKVPGDEKVDMIIKFFQRNPNHASSDEIKDSVPEFFSCITLYAKAAEVIGQDKIPKILISRMSRTEYTNTFN